MRHHNHSSMWDNNHNNSSSVLCKKKTHACMHTKNERIMKNTTSTTAIMRVDDSQPNAARTATIAMNGDHHHDEKTANPQNSQKMYSLLLNVTDRAGNTALHHATQQGNLDVVKELVKAIGDGGREESKKRIVMKLNRNGNSPLHVACLLGHCDIAKYLSSQQNSIIIMQRNPMDGNTPLHYASMNGHIDIVKFFIMNGIDDLNAKNKNGSTALHYASLRGHLDIVRCLCGARIASNKDDIKEATYDNADTHDDIDADGNKIMNRHHYCVESDGHSIELPTTKSKATTTITTMVNANARNVDGNTPVHYASKSQNELQVVRYLIGCAGADGRVRNNEGITPLRTSEMFKCEDTMEYLIKSSSSVLDDK
mmetsp:Transcript_21827/g.62185  ORF Transcript_21827/g.62185 Transcript_21827/m.62185 type:complete len:368 (-) Transcript_21827:117-1220(-)|eukprot:CAMPEP_0119568854 /NCGR_PEP_ID=MMETSP1352-20130426/40013_1 /TAXON_ID=265584 /ORGANISM="Stauroneis constricta, Strain CCMP1120" /LENGTH=367 /DNA_ID=CAMNT_0007618317 /DNA_START=417 /DNA_END=1520 /DNA_ORIENTATION=-